MSEVPGMALHSSISVDTERLLTFEHEAAIYALPIAEVHEVAEVERICCVPTIPSNQVGVMNWHGDALPVVAAELLFDCVEEPPDGEPPIERAELADGLDRKDDTSGERRGLRPGHVLVISGRDDEPARLGLPIDRVLGLVDGPVRRRGSNDLIVERRPLDGRVVNVLDPRRLVERAKEVIGRQVR